MVEINGSHAICLFVWSGNCILPLANIVALSLSHLVTLGGQENLGADGGSSLLDLYLCVIYLSGWKQDMIFRFQAKEKKNGYFVEFSLSPSGVSTRGKRIEGMF